MSHNQWRAFPATTRAEEIQEILLWVRRGESGMVIGGSGSGKSNLAGFIANRPDVTATYLPNPIEDYCFLYVDFNGLPGETTTNFYRAMLNTIYLASDFSPELKAQVERLIDRIPSYRDRFGLYMALQQAHDLLLRKHGKYVVWLFDRFDSACQNIEATTLNTLRGLRDQFRYQLSYISFTREPLERLRDSAEYDEFYELMVLHKCWVRGMTLRDNRFLAQQVMRRHDAAFDEATIIRVHRMCGGLPAFIRGCYSALARGELQVEQDDKMWIERLVQLDEIKRNCREMWRECSEEEQEIIVNVAHGTNLVELRGSSLDYLKNLGWLLQTDKAPEITIFSPIFSEWIKRRHQSRRVLSLQDNDKILIDGLPLAIDVPPTLKQLLIYLLKNEGCTCKHEVLIQDLNPKVDLKDIHQLMSLKTNLTSHIRHLRDKLKEVNANYEYIKSVSRIGYRFDNPEVS